MFKFTPQDLRKYPTPTEAFLWSYLRARRMVGLKFRRQHPIGPYIVDFACLREKIVIEIDGLIHEKQKPYDLRRDKWIQSQGYSILRIKNEDLDKNREEVLRKIRAYLLRRMGF